MDFSLPRELLLALAVHEICQQLITVHWALTPHWAPWVSPPVMTSLNVDM